MSTPQQDPSPPTTRRRALAAVAVFLVAAGTIVACSDGPVGLGRRAPSLERESATPTALESRAGRRDGASPNPYLWVGREHNRGLEAIEKMFANRTGGLRDPKTRCTWVRSATREYVLAGQLERGAGDHLMPDARLLDEFLDAARICDPSVLGMSLVDAVRAAGRRLQADYEPSPDAVHLLNVLELQVDQMTSAAQLDRSIVPIEQDAQALLVGLDHALVLGATSIGRSSAYHAESVFPPGGSGPGSPPPMQDQRIAGGGGTGRNSAIVKSDIRGCIMGGISGIRGGPSGILAGCVTGGIIASVDKIIEQWQE